MVVVIADDTTLEGATPKSLRLENSPVRVIGIESPVDMISFRIRSSVLSGSVLVIFQCLDQRPRFLNEGAMLVFESSSFVANGMNRTKNQEGSGALLRCLLGA